MTSFEWIMVSISAGGFVLSASGVLAGCIWGVATIKHYTIEQITAEQSIRSRDIAKVMATFVNDQKTQDHNFGEMGSALRRFIETVEKEMHEIEMWGRDHYALKHDVEKSISELRSDIKEMRADIKTDLRNIGSKIDARS